MSQLQVITKAFEGLTKSQISIAAKNAVDNILEHGGSDKVAEFIASMEQFTKEVRKDEKFIEYVCEEAKKHNGKLTTPSGAKIELCETGVSYDYSLNPQWVELDSQEAEIKAKRTELEKRLQKIPAGKLLVDEDSGETLIGPARSSKSNYKLTLAK